MKNVSNDADLVNKLILKELNRKPVPLEYIQGIKKYADDRRYQRIKAIRQAERKRNWNFIKDNFNFKKDGYFDLLWRLIKFSIIVFFNNIKNNTIMVCKKLYLFITIPPKKKVLLKGVDAEKLSNKYRKHLLKNNIDINEIKRINRTINSEEIKTEPFMKEGVADDLIGDSNPKKIKRSLITKLVYPTFDLFKFNGNNRNLLPE